MDDLQLDKIRASYSDAGILVVVVQAFQVHRRHDLNDRPDRVGELPAPLPVAVGDPVIGCAEFPGIGLVFMDFLKVRQSVAVGIRVLSRRVRLEELAGHLDRRPAGHRQGIAIIARFRDWLIAACEEVR